jgi:hypothetical protein
MEAHYHLLLFQGSEGHSVLGRHRETESCPGLSADPTEFPFTPSARLVVLDELEGRR